MLVTFRDGPMDGKLLQVPDPAPEIMRFPVLDPLPAYVEDASPPQAVEWDTIEYRKTRIAHGGIRVFQYTG